MAKNADLKVATGVSPQEERMVYAVAQGMTYRDAAAEAGFEFKDAYRGAKRIMEKPECRQLLRKIRAEIAARSKITQDDVIEGFKDAVNDAKLAGDPQSQIAGWREIAKMLGFYAPEVRKVEVSHTAREAQRELAQLSDDDLLALVDENDNVIDGEFRLLDS